MLLKLVFLLVFTVRVSVVCGEDPPTEDAVKQVMSAIKSTLKTLPEIIKTDNVWLGSHKMVHVLLSGISEVEQGEWEMTQNNEQQFKFSLIVRHPNLEVKYKGKTYSAGKANIKLCIEFVKPNQENLKHRHCVMETYFPTRVYYLPYFTLSPLDLFKKEVNLGDVNVLFSSCDHFHAKVKERVEEKIGSILEKGFAYKKNTQLFGCPEVYGQ